jgi:hypothetical protein
MIEGVNGRRIAGMNILFLILTSHYNPLTAASAQRSPSIAAETIPPA